MKKLETVLVLNPNSMVVVEEIPLELLAFVPRVEETLSTNKGHYCIAEVGYCLEKGTVNLYVDPARSDFY